MRIPKKDKPAVTPAKGKGKVYGKQRAATKGKISNKGDARRKAPVKPKGKPAKGKPAKGKPAKGRPAKGRPAKGRPAKGRPAKGKPTRVIRVGRQGKKNRLVKRCVRLSKKKRRQKFKDLARWDFATECPEYLAALDNIFYARVNPCGVQFDLERILGNLFGKLECLEGEQKRKPQNKKQKQRKFQPRRYKLSEGSEESLDDLKAGFWKFVEVYSADFKEDAVKSIEDSINSHESGVFYTIPPLGGHLIKEVNNQRSKNSPDEGEIKENGVQLVNGTGGCVNGTGESVNGTGGYVNGAGGTNTQNGKFYDAPVGPLAQRLASCFMEETPDIVARLRGYKNKAPPKVLIPPNPEFVTCFNLPPTIESAEELDDRIKKKLFKLGILDSLELEEPEDKVLTKLQTLQSRLKAISAQTVPVRKRILELAKKDMPLQSYFKEVEQAENKLITAYRKMSRLRTFYPEVYKEDRKVMAYKREHDLLESRHNSTVMKFLLEYQEVVQRSENRTEADD
ncbi:uncharacterized protein LOC118201737 isoform X2 [Stegodyphus dumicola]|uniref:uncharacterized protein LOC118201737 isoform X2 n=1 Tax=Stegodyphus dumicola TaxID=202533 RepID=UPI0015AB35B4|nr:uncharacterized protein LOC118201737 isoform X2 [Stegodyphus dumicola]